MYILWYTNTFLVLIVESIASNEYVWVDSTLFSKSIETVLANESVSLKPRDTTENCNDFIYQPQNDFVWQTSTISPSKLRLTKSVYRNQPHQFVLRPPFLGILRAKARGANKRSAVGPYLYITQVPSSRRAPVRSKPPNAHGKKRVIFLFRFDDKLKNNHSQNATIPPLITKIALENTSLNVTPAPITQNYITTQNFISSTTTQNIITSTTTQNFITSTTTQTIISSTTTPQPSKTCKYCTCICENSMDLCSLCFKGTATINCSDPTTTDETPSHCTSVDNYCSTEPVIDSDATYGLEVTEIMCDNPVILYQTPRDWPPVSTRKQRIDEVVQTQCPYDECQGHDLNKVNGVCPWLIYMMGVNKNLADKEWATTATTELCTYSHRRRPNSSAKFRGKFVAVILGLFIVVV